MPNYRGNTNDYMRRNAYNQNRGRRPGNCGTMQTPTPYTTYNEPSPCCEHDDELSQMPLAMAYVPWQNWKRIYDKEQAFCRGTIFEELDKPFCGMGGCNS
ncbi:spore coat associated protein CotJA [Roseburia hominis]